jgi:cell wall-associated NlpC family hydrolase
MRASPLLRVLVCSGFAVVVLAFLAGHGAATPRPAAPARHHATALRPRRHGVRLRRARIVRARNQARDRVVTRAWRAVGVRYRWGGASLSGFDCSGLTRWVYRSIGVSLPHASAAQWRYGRRVSRRALQPGDLLFFSGLSHVGIYLGHGALIHAPHPGARVRFARLSGWFSSSFDGARRFRVTG